MIAARGMGTFSMRGWASSLGVPILLVGLLLAAFWLQVDGPSDPHISLVLSDVVVVAGAVFATAFTAVAGLSKSGRQRLSWLLISAGVGFWSVGEIAWTFYDAAQGEAPFPSWLDGAYLAGYPPLMLGAVLLASPSRAWAQARTALDAGALVLAGVAIAWRLVLGPIYADTESTIWARAVGGAYPLGDLVVVFATALLVSRGLRCWRTMLVVGPLAGGAMLIAAADMEFAYFSMHGLEGQLDLLNLQWTLGYVGIAAAGYLQRRMKLEIDDQSAETPASSLRNAAPLGVLVFQLGFATAQREALLADPLYLAFGWCSIMLIVARQYVVLRDNENLNLALARTGQELEMRVVDRTKELTRLAAILEATPDFVGTADRDGNTLYLNRSGRRMMGMSATGEFEAMAIADFHPGWAATLVAEQGLPAAVRDGTWTGETALLAKDGKEIPTSQVIIAHRSEAGEVQYFSTIARDITDRKEFESRLVDLANHDSLTRLFNRRRFEEELEQELARARRFQHGAALLFIDLDGFKFINDDLGHRVGDQVLTEVARVLQECVRETDTLARLGGDEFAVLLPQTTPDEAEEVAGRILAGLRDVRLAVQSEIIRVTASIGIALAPEHGVVADELLARADLAMYGAKDTRDRHQVFDPGRTATQEFVSRREWEERIHRALETNRFCLYAQPIRDLRSGDVQYEVLIRMTDESGNIILPGAFMPVAERTGLIQQIDRWVVSSAIDLLAAAEARGERVTLEVNLSGRAFDDDTLLPLIRERLVASGVDASTLVLEITETSAIANIGKAQAFISALKSMGCRFAIDDFGVGFSSFYYLKTLPVDYLKIDGSFIRNLPRDAADQHLVRSMVELARGLGKKTIAEFVGDEATVELLRLFGVDFGQGFYLGEPRPVEQALLQRGQQAA